jgi:hypothetical protein
MERYAMFLEIGFGFIRVPFKFHVLFYHFLWANDSDDPLVHLNYKHYTEPFSFVMKFWHILLLLQLSLDSSMRPAETQANRILGSIILIILRGTTGNLYYAYHLSLV